MSSGEFDIVIFGPTGVTGREVVRYLATRAVDAGVSWAVAGRDRRRCEDVLATAGAEGVGFLEVDVTDRRAVMAVVDRARVVANLVGPYARFGQHVYESCASTGTDQVDVCGEIDWMATQVGQLHDLAQATGSRIVMACGFESLPFDLATVAVAEAASACCQDPLASMDVALTVRPDPTVVRAKDVVSGGTVRSAADAIRRGALSTTRDVRLLDPRPHEAKPLDLRPWRHPTGDRWVGPLLPSPYITPAIVYRTAGLSTPTGSRFADDFRYRDGVVGHQLIPGVSGASASAWLFGLQLVNQVLTDGPSKVNQYVADLVETLGPPPGEGPSPAHLAGWTWRLDAVGATVSGRVHHASVAGSGHPGYRATAQLAAEAALRFATTGVHHGGGLLTPGACFGPTDLARWRQAGCEFVLGEQPEVTSREPENVR